MEHLLLQNIFLLGLSYGIKGVDLNITLINMLLSLFFCYCNVSLDYLSQVYAIDYGLAKKYRDLQTHKHIPYRLVLM